MVSDDKINNFISISLQEHKSSLYQSAAELSLLLLVYKEQSISIGSQNISISCPIGCYDNMLHFYWLKQMRLSSDWLDWLTVPVPYVPPFYWLRQMRLSSDWLACLTVQLPSVELSQQQEEAVCRPAPFFCTHTRHSIQWGGSGPWPCGSS